MKKKNGFTLIELLAILVILAIIAVITIPKINKVINESKQNAARNSAYGYKGAIEKWETSQQEDDIYLNGNYTISNGKLDNYTIPITGSAPSSGYLTYEDDDLINGCLVINGYEAIYQNGKFTSTGKGDCGGVIPATPAIPSCPGCKFIFTTYEYAILGSEAADDDYYITDMPTTQDGLTDDYTTLIGEGGHPYFLGLIESTTTPGTIERAFACGVENGTLFCLEGYDTSKWSADANVGVLNTIFPSCNASASNSLAECNGWDVSASGSNTGNVGVENVNINSGCHVYGYGNVVCIVDSGR